MEGRLISRIFRFFNSKLIDTDNIIIEKILKIVLWVSGIVYRRQTHINEQSKVEFINNFDSTIKMKVDIARSMGSAIYWTGFHEFREFIFLHRFLKPEMIFVDIGANQGEYSLFAAKRLTNGKVFSFEPLPSILKVFKENIGLNNFSNINIFDCGLSDRAETLSLFEMEDVHEGLATLYPGLRKKGEEYKVQLKKLDDIFEHQKSDRVDFIKLDIEGGELKALQGGRRVIEKFKPLVMVEINKITYAAAGYTVEDVVQFFKSLGYKPFTIMKRGLLKECASLPDFGNVIFKPQ